MKSFVQHILERWFPALAKEIRFRAIRRLPLCALKDHRLFEPELKLIKPLLRGMRGICLDIGAHVGEYCYALEQCIPASNIYAFEPNPETCALLRRFFPRIHVEHVALSDERGTAILSIPRRGTKSYATRGTLEHSDATDEKISVVLATVDIFSSSWNLPVVFMKIDVEGHERKVLAGGRGVIERYHPIILIEIEERHSGVPIAEEFREVEARGYRGYFLDLRAGSLLPVHAFDPKVRQREEEMKSVDYINNFLFFPVQSAEMMITRLQQVLDGCSSIHQ